MVFGGQQLAFGRWLNLKIYRRQILRQTIPQMQTIKIIPKVQSEAFSDNVYRVCTSTIGIKSDSIIVSSLSWFDAQRLSSWRLPLQFVGLAH